MALASPSLKVYLPSTVCLWIKLIPCLLLDNGQKFNAVLSDLAVKVRDCNFISLVLVLNLTCGWIKMIRYWSEIGCSIIVTHQNDLEVNVTDFEIC